MFKKADGRNTNGGSDGAKSLQKRHHRVALSLAGLVVLMTSLSFAAVPAYKLFCQVTGYGGTTQKAERPADYISNQYIRIRFDSTISPDLNWEFQPVQKVVDVKIGQSTLIFYRARNQGERDTIGTATFNVTPEGAGVYFNKMQCFCFTEQKLAAGQSADMPVDFYIDPAILDDKDARQIKEVTLSYTFFPVEESVGQSKSESNLIKTKIGKSGSKI